MVYQTRGGITIPVLRDVFRQRFPRNGHYIRFQQGLKIFQQSGHPAVMIEIYHVVFAGWVHFRNLRSRVREVVK